MKTYAGNSTLPEKVQPMIAAIEDQNEIWLCVHSHDHVSIDGRMSRQGLRDLVAALDALEQAEGQS